MTYAGPRCTRADAGWVRWCFSVLHPCSALCTWPRALSPRWTQLNPSRGRIEVGRWATRAGPGPGRSPPSGVDPARVRLARFHRQRAINLMSAVDRTPGLTSHPRSSGSSRTCRMEPKPFQKPYPRPVVFGGASPSEARAAWPRPCGMGPNAFFWGGLLHHRPSFAEQVPDRPARGNSARGRSGPPERFPHRQARFYTIASTTTPTGAGNG